MRAIVRGAVIVAACLSYTASARAQDARDLIEDKVRPGDKLTIAMRDGREIKGRFVAGATDVMILADEGNEVRVRRTDVDSLKRRRNGVLLGAIIGASAGAATGIPVAMLMENEHGQGAEALTSMTLLGLGVGIGIDALLSTDRKVYDRPAQARLEFLPQRGGGSMRVTLSW